MPPPVATAPGERRGAGRPLDPRRDAAIIDATLSGLADLGYDRLTIEEVAGRARVGKATIYRRWASKADLVAAAVVAWREQLAPRAPLPDTGSLAGDLDALVDVVPDLSGPVGRQLSVVVGLLTAAWRDPELRRALDGLLERPRALLGQVVRQAVARGEIPAGRDVGLVPDVIIGLNVVRLLGGEPPDRAYAARVARTVLWPLLTAPEDRPNGAGAT